MAYPAIEDWVRSPAFRPDAGTSPGGLSGLISRSMVGSIPIPATMTVAYIFCEPCQRGEHDKHLAESDSADGRYHIICRCDGEKCVSEYEFVTDLYHWYTYKRG